MTQCCANPDICTLAHAVALVLQSFNEFSVAVCRQEMQSGADNMPAMCPDLFERLVVMSDLAVHPPKLNKTESRTSASGRAAQVKY